MMECGERCAVISGAELMLLLYVDNLGTPVQVSRFKKSTLAVNIFLLITLLGAIPRLNAAFGQGIGPILFDDVQCNGFEQRLFDCSHPGLEVNNCGHHEDAGVECSAGKQYHLFSVNAFL